MEWLFYITRPSFSAAFTFAEAVRMLLFAPLPLLFLAFSAHVLFELLAAAIKPPSLKRWVSTFVPTLVLAFVIFLLIDNFTYTVFEFGVTSVPSSSHGWFGIWFAALFYWVNRRWSPIYELNNRRFEPGSRLTYAAGGLLVLSVVSTVVMWLVTSPYKLEAPGGSSSPLSDVFLISADGLQADLLSPYNKGNSTPFLKRFSNETVVWENMFANVNRTAGSLGSVISGKHGTTTHKLHSGHLFKGKDSYEHLAGLFKLYGYSNFQHGWRRNHCDASAWNMAGAFDQINGHRPLSLYLHGRMGLEKHFVETMIQRVHERGQSIFLKVTGARRRHFTDDDGGRVLALQEFMKRHSPPVFAQMHFSVVESGVQADIFDRHIKNLVSFLKENNRYDNALIMIYSDHGREYCINCRIPLIIKFPKSFKPPKINPSINAQLIDIAPTVLDVLGVSAPGWMEGQSLLKPLSVDRRIFGVWSSSDRRGLALVGRPSTSLGGPLDMRMIVRNWVFQIECNSGKLEIFPMPGHTAPVARSGDPSAEAARAELLDHLSKRGYDIARIPNHEK